MGYRRTLAQLVVCCGLGCGARVALDDDVSGTSSADTSVSDPSTSVSATMPATMTTADSGNAIDLGSEDPFEAELCPTPSAEGVGIDTRMRIAFPSAGEPEIVAAEPMRLVCNGVSIAGSTSTGVGQVVFVPDEELPPQSGCEIVLEPSSVTLDDVPLVGTSWTFFTGDLRGVDLDFAGPTTLGEFSGGGFVTIDADGDDVVVAWVGDFPMLARSNDRGEHFEVSSLMPDVYGSNAIVTHLQNGIVHATWCMYPVSGSVDCFYARSEPGLGAMSPAMLVDDDDPDTFSSSPTVTSDGDDIVVVAWFESCNIEPCNLPGGSGIYERRSADGGLTFDEIVQVSSGWTKSPSAGPLLAWVDGGVAVAWNAKPFAYEGISILDGEAEPTKFWERENAMWPSLERADDDEAVLYWHERESVESGFDAAKFVRIRGRSPAGVERVQTVAERQGDADFGVVMDAHGDVVVAIVAEGEFFTPRGSLERRLVFSQDGGATFLAPLTLDHFDTGADRFGLEPYNVTVAAADAERVHFVWMRDTEALTFEVMHSYADRIEPCGVRVPD